jgi:gas vesicle protein
MPVMPDSETHATSRHTATIFTLGLFCGAAMGAMAGLLLAPKPGADMRKDLAKSAQELSKRAAQVYTGAAARVQELARGAAASGHDVVDAIGSRART